MDSTQREVFAASASRSPGTTTTSRPALPVHAVNGEKSARRRADAHPGWRGGKHIIGPVRSRLPGYAATATYRPDSVFGQVVYTRERGPPGSASFDDGQVNAPLLRARHLPRRRVGRFGSSGAIEPRRTWCALISEAAAQRKILLLFFFNC